MRRDEKMCCRQRAPVQMREGAREMCGCAARAADTVVAILPAVSNGTTLT